MKCISLWQPWAIAWLTDLKEYETRSWPTNHRGVLLVHAAKKRDGDVAETLRYPEVLEDLESQFIHPDDLKFGCILGMVKLIDCIPTVRAPAVSDTERRWGDWTFGRFAWRRSVERIIFENPVPWRGAQGLFDVQDIRPLLSESAQATARIAEFLNSIEHVAEATRARIVKIAREGATG